MQRGGQGTSRLSSLEALWPLWEGGDECFGSDRKPGLYQAGSPEPTENLGQANQTRSACQMSLPGQQCWSGTGWDGGAEAKHEA